MATKLLVVVKADDLTWPVIVNHFNSVGCDVQVAHTVSAAKKMVELKKNPIEAVILDVLAFGDLVDLFMGKIKKLPTLFLGGGSDSQTQSLIEDGRFYVLKKPVTVFQIQKALLAAIKNTEGR